jgi:serine/threonine protein kinase
VEPDGNESLKVLEFGIARSHSRRALTRGHIGVGSPGYMSPEQVEGTGHVDPRSDIWGLGVVMYELLAHRPAFFGDNPQTLCLQILTSDVTPLLELKPSLPPALVYIVERCMAREPDRRFANVAELAEALAPLDEWSPGSDAELIRRRLAATEESPVSQTRPQQARQLPSVDVVVTDPGVVPPPRRNRRRLASLLLAAVLLAPVIALLPRVAQAPELAPARAWSMRALQQSQAADHHVRDRAKELWMKEPGGSPPPGQP